VLTRGPELDVYAADASIARPGGAPLAVVLPRESEQVGAVLRQAARAGVPVVTRGAGSGLAGGATPVAGALVLSLAQLDWLEIDPVQQVAHVAAGVVTADVQRAAAAHGLLYAPDPSSQRVSTIGGNLACNAGGPRCLKYGVTANYVLGLTAVLADGSVVRVGDGLSGQSPDAGLLHLLAGSEGTLAVITAATLRLIRPPATSKTILALYDRLDDASATVEAIMASGVLPAGLELMDDVALRVVRETMGAGLPDDVGALLLMLVDGEPEAVAAEAAQLADLARQGGARSAQVAASASDEANFWQARRSIGGAFAQVRPHKISEDICVPLSQIVHTVREVKRIAAHYELTIPVFGHAGDGNLHPNVLFNARDPDETARAWQAAEAIFQVALAVGGTLSGEHGIGTIKRPYLAQALGEDVLALCRQIKAQYDPAGRLNPGKMV
jgi:glycolate oxidase subunit GlcD